MRTSAADANRRREAIPAALGSACGTDSARGSPLAASRRKRKLPSASRKLTTRAVFGALGFFFDGADDDPAPFLPRPTALRKVSSNGMAVARALAAPAWRMSSMSSGRAISRS